MKVKSLGRAWSYWQLFTWQKKLGDDALSQISIYQKELFKLRQEAGVRHLTLLLSGSHTRLLYLGFRRWNKNLQLMKDLASGVRTMHKVFVRLSQKSLSQGWGSWLAVFKEYKRNQQLMGKVLSRVQHLHLLRGWNQWKSNTLNLLNGSFAVELLLRWIGKREAANLRRFFRHWHRSAQLLYRQSAGVEALLRKLMYSGLRKQMKAFSTWKSTTISIDQARREKMEHLRKLSSVFDRALRSQRCQTLSSGWNIWRWHAHALRLQEMERATARTSQLVKALIGHLQQSALFKLREAMNTWIGLVFSTQSYEAATLIMRKTFNRILQQAIFRGFNTWKLAAIEAARQAQLLTKVLRRMTRLKVSCGWTAWISWVYYVKEQEALRARSLQVMNLAILRLKSLKLHSAMMRWKTVIWYQDIATSLLMKLMKMFTNQQTRMLAKGWKTWTSFVSALKDVEAAKFKNFASAIASLVKALTTQRVVRIAKAWATWKWLSFVGLELAAAANKSRIALAYRGHQEGFRVLQYLLATTNSDKLKVAFQQWRLFVDACEEEIQRVQKMSLVLAKSLVSWQRLRLCKSFKKWSNVIFFCTPDQYAESCTPNAFSVPVRSAKRSCSILVNLEAACQNAWDARGEQPLPIYDGRSNVSRTVSITKGVCFKSHFILVHQPILAPTCLGLASVVCCC